jgi:hypothetical protein
LGLSKSSGLTRGTPPWLSESMSRLGGFVSKLSTSSTRHSAPKLNTIQLGPTAVLNPENYAQQTEQNNTIHSRGKLPPWLSRSQDEGISNPDIQLENSLLIPPSREVSSAEDLAESGTTRIAQPRQMLGINKCQSFNCWMKSQMAQTKPSRFCSYLKLGCSDWIIIFCVETGITSQFGSFRNPVI